jgi:hypothetical protein
VWKSTNNLTPMSYISDPDVWLRKELLGNTIPIGEWIILGNAMNIRPRLGSPVVGPPASPAETVTFYYLKNTCVKLASGGYGNQFLADGDSFVLPERLLKLGMIWQWKANKGASYAEDMANYEDALSRIAGNDKPSPILVGGRPLASDENIAYWGPTPPANTFVGPGR